MNYYGLRIQFGDDPEDCIFYNPHTRQFAPEVTGYMPESFFIPEPFLPEHQIAFENAVCDNGHFLELGPHSFHLSEIRPTDPAWEKIRRHHLEAPQ